MKLIILSIAIFSPSVTNNSYANENNAMDKIIEKGISFNNAELSANNKQNEFVRVMFRIDKENQIEIIESNSSDEFFNDLLLKKLTSLALLGSLGIKNLYLFKYKISNK